MSDDPDKDYGDRYTWKEGDLVLLKEGHGEPMSDEDFAKLLERRPDNRGRPGQPPAEAPDAQPDKPNNVRTAVHIHINQPRRK